MQTVTIGNQDRERRLDRFLKAYLPRAPKGLLYKSLRKKNIVLNGIKAQGDETLALGDEITFYFSDETMEKFRPLPKRFAKHYPKILYEDSEILVLEKPRGVLTHGAGDYRDEDMVSRMIFYLRDQGEYRPGREGTFTPAVVNRLDRQTSGILLGAKTAPILRELNARMKARELKKVYWGLVEGAWTYEGVYRNRLQKNASRNRVHAAREGQEAESIFRPLLVSDKMSLVEVELVTGRTHQIRAQAKALGHPIVGDGKYGAKSAPLKGQWLHNVSLSIPETFSGEARGKTFHAPLPEELARILREGLGERADEFCTGN